MRLLPILLAFLAFALPAAARADIEVGFWSRELGLELPHAFITIKGTVDGRAVDESFGYTPKAITPAILWGPVPGRIDLTTRGYIAASNKHFTVTVPDAAYARLKAIVERHSAKPGSVYYMDTHNCVTFVGEAARAVGLVVPDNPRLLKRPTSYLAAIAAANAKFPTLVLAHK